MTTAAPAAEPVTVAAAKEYLRIDAGDDSFDTQVGDWIAASRADAEYISGTRMITQTVELRASGWSDLEQMPIGPVQSISKIEYLDSDSVLQTLDSGVYVLVKSGLIAGIGFMSGAVWPTIADRRDAIRVTAVVGYGDAGSDMPADLYFAIMRAVRSKMDDMDFDLAPMLNNHRIWL